MVERRAFVENIKRFLIGLLGSLLMAFVQSGYTACTMDGTSLCYKEYDKNALYCSYLDNIQAPRIPAANYLVSYGDNYFFLNGNTNYNGGEPDPNLQPYEHGWHLLKSWSESTQYADYSVVLYQDKFYRSTASQKGKNPSTDTTNWTFICNKDGTVPAPALAASFNVVETLAAHPSPSTWSDPIKGVIHTKVSGTTFQLDIVALDSTDMNKAKPQTTFTGTVKVELLDMSSANNDCSKGKVIQTLTTTTEFLASDSGRKQKVNFSEANAYRNVRVRVTYPEVGTPQASGCSTDNFAIRPNHFASVAAKDANWETAGTTRPLDNVNATGGNVHKAGRPFTLFATAYNSAKTAAVTTNYDGSPTVKTAACTLPTPTCVDGTPVLGKFSAVSGKLTSDEATYPEVGVFNLTLEDRTYADVDAVDGSTEKERFIPQDKAVALGRFVPDHFDLKDPRAPQFKTFNTTDATCSGNVLSPKRSFTYIGQAFGYATTPQTRVVARNAAEVLTENYSANLWKLSDSTGMLVDTAKVALAYTSAEKLDVSQVNNKDKGTAATLVPGTGGGTDTARGSGMLTINDILTFVRDSATPVAPFYANISLTIGVKDTSEKNVPGNGDIETTLPLKFSGDANAGISFDSGNEFRYGILKLLNAHGSGLVKLSIPMEAQYWTGGGFITNAKDHCTTIQTFSILMSNYQKKLEACETSLIMSGALTNGASNLQLSAPSTQVIDNSGSVDLTVNLGTPITGLNCLVQLGTQTSTSSANLGYLQGKWAGSATYEKDPTARATFGVFRSGPVIYMREVY